MADYSSSQRWAARVWKDPFPHLDTIPVGLPTARGFCFNQAEMIGGSRFYVVGTDGETPRQVLTKFTAGPYENHHAISAAWHPDGQRISVWVWDNSDPVSFWTAAAEQGTAVKSQISPEILKQIGGVSADFLGFSEWADDFKWMNRRRQWLSRTRLHPREHEGIGVRVRTPRPPQVNRLAHGLGDRDKAVIGASVAVLAFDFLALQAGHATRYSR